MGSQITRALGRTDRRRRLTAQQQVQAKQYVKVFNCAMLSILIFGNAFMTSHSTEAHQTCYEYMLLSLLSAILINSSNPQVLLLCGWLMVIVQSLFLPEKSTLLFNVGTLLTLFSIYTNIYNYFSFLHPLHPFIKNLVPSVLIFIAQNVYTMGHCSSHLTKQMRQKSTSMQIYEQHGIGIRIMFCILGAMVIVLSTIAHTFIRTRRFMPISISEQLNFIKQIGVVNILQGVLFIAGLQSLKINQQQVYKCQSGVGIVTHLIITATIAILFSVAINNYYSKTNQARYSINSQTIIIFGILCLKLIVQLIGAPYWVGYPLYILLAISIFMSVTNLIHSQLRVNYAIAFIVAIQNQTNKVQHMHTAVDKQVQLTNIIIYGVCFTFALLVPYLARFAKYKLGCNITLTHANPETIQLVQNNPY